MRYLALAALLTILAGCHRSYVTPGRGADMSAFGLRREAQTDLAVQDRLDIKPLARFPATIALVRAQHPGYESRTAISVGRGRYSVVTTRDVESDAAIRRIASLPMVTGVATLPRMLIPEQLNSDLDLRQAAATLHADLVLVYTIDSAFATSDSLQPLSIVTAGLSPNVGAQVTSTASAVLMDTRNGYVYAVAEASSKKAQLANYWTSDEAVDQVRRRTEAEAFEKLATDFERAWGQVVTQYSRPVAVN